MYPYDWKAKSIDAYEVFAYIDKLVIVCEVVKSRTRVRDFHYLFLILRIPPIVKSNCLAVEVQSQSLTEESLVMREP